MQVGIERMRTAQAPTRLAQRVDRIAGGHGLIVVRAVGREVGDDVDEVVDPPGHANQTTVARGECGVTNMWRCERPRLRLDGRVRGEVGDQKCCQGPAETMAATRRWEWPDQVRSRSSRSCLPPRERTHELVENSLARLVSWCRVFGKHRRILRRLVRRRKPT